MLESQNEWVVHAKVKRLRDAPEPWKYEGAMDPKIKILCWPHPMHQGLGRMIIPCTELDRIFADATRYE